MISHPKEGVYCGVKFLSFYISPIPSFSQVWQAVHKVGLCMLQVLASKSPSLLDFHLDLSSLEAASKVSIFLGIKFKHYV